MVSTKPVRIWKELAHIIEELSDNYGYVMSDLISAILITALTNPSIVAQALYDWFEVDWEEAKRDAFQIAASIRYILEEEEEEEIEEKEEKVKAIG